MSGDASRVFMLRDIALPGGGGGDASSKALLIRGCDAVMTARAGAVLPPLFGGVRIVAATDDDSFFELLRGEKFDAINFAPGACRWGAAGQAIPGGDVASRGWTLAEYRAEVRATQGSAVPIVETTEERLMAPSSTPYSGSLTPDVIQTDFSGKAVHKHSRRRRTPFAGPAPIVLVRAPIVLVRSVVLFPTGAPSGG
ncbi:hypothetical protein M885DRAFT_627199 [Pelagophyceae sp. CCMP2097]|nr:hypothetical protein M885DRAFT_627199 [Pelagophyceae sp. CCMP2097]